MIVCHRGQAQVSHRSNNTASKGQEEWLLDLKDQFMITKSVPKITFDVTGQLDLGLIKLFTYFTESSYFFPTPAVRILVLVQRWHKEVHIVCKWQNDQIL